MAYKFTYVIFLCTFAAANVFYQSSSPRRKTGASDLRLKWDKIIKIRKSASKVQIFL